MSVKFAQVSVVIPTIGRPLLLKETLNSLANCEPQPAEILVVDQSDELTSEALIRELGVSAARTLPCLGRGRGRAVNEGLRNAAHQLVLVTDDDCTVRSDWVAAAHAAMLEDPEGIITGQVLPAPGGDPRAVPSTLFLAEPREYTGRLLHGALWGGNMACPRDSVLDIGGFDEAIRPSAEDCDFCYRWLRAGRRLRHVADLVVWHHDWRTPDALVQHYVGYYHGLGMFYAKHLRGGDLRMLRFLAGDCYNAFRSLVSRLFRRVPRWADPRRGAFEGLPRGLRDGWRQFRPGRSAGRPLRDGG